MIAVVVIGGANLAGGVGSMGGTFIGLLIIGVLNNGLSLLHVNPNLQSVVIGAVILAAVLTDRVGIKLRLLTSHPTDLTSAGRPNRRKVAPWLPHDLPNMPCPPPRLTTPRTRRKTRFG